MNSPNSSKTGGFTLVEVLLVIALMGVILGGAYLNFDSSVAKTRQDVNVSNIARLEGAAQLYRLDLGTYPMDFNELIENTTQSEHWRGPYVDDIPVNPLNPGQAYQIDVMGRVR